MKSLVQWIAESVASGHDKMQISDLKVSWKITDPKNDKGDVIIKVPQDYADDDIKSYLQDMLLEKMPTDDSLAKDYFGANADDIVDVSIDYDNAQVNREDKRNLTFEFDSSIDDTYKGNDNELKRVTVTNLRLVATFDIMTIENTSKDDLKSDLMDILYRTCSSKNVEYMNGKIELTLDENDVEYDEARVEIVKD